MQKADTIFSFMLDYTTRNMRRYAAETFADERLGITVDQWGVLLLLRDHAGGLSNRELAERMVKDKPTTSRIIDVLVRKSLVARKADQNDRRLLRIGLTAKGRATAKRAEPIVTRLREEIGSSLTKAQQKGLVDCLDLLNERIDALRERKRA